MKLLTGIADKFEFESKARKIIEEVIIPEGYLYVGEKAFFDCPKLKKITLPSTLTEIGENAFSDTKVKSVTLPSSCREVDWFAFYGCYALSTLYLSSSVNNIGYGAFDGCSKTLTIYCESNSYAEKYAQSFGISYSNYQ